MGGVVQREKELRTEKREREASKARRKDGDKGKRELRGSVSREGKAQVG